MVILFNIINNQNPILVVGESLSGLSTAIGLAQAGIPTTVVKKRIQYTREARIFINNDRLEFLIHLGVFKQDEVPSFTLEKKKRIILPICVLEEKLYERAQELNIPIIMGEFKGLPHIHKALVQTSDIHETHVPYSYIVGADGAKSAVRQALNIPCRQISGPTKAASVFIATQAGDPSVEEIERNSFFLRKVSTPQGKFILLHNKTEMRTTDKEKIIASLRECAFHNEADAVQESKSFNVADVTVQLQQAEAFCDKQYHALLVGDATVTGSFFLGRGGNLALKSAEIAVQFFEKMKESETDDPFEWFNLEMQQVTNELIRGNKYLFKQLLN